MRTKTVRIGTLKPGDRFIFPHRGECMVTNAEPIFPGSTSWVSLKTGYSSSSGPTTEVQVEAQPVGIGTLKPGDRFTFAGDGCEDYGERMVTDQKITGCGVPYVRLRDGYTTRTLGTTVPVFPLDNPE